MSELIEAAREALGPAVATRFAQAGTLRVVMLDPLLEQDMLEGMRSAADGAHIVLEPDRLEAIIASVKSAVAGASDGGETVLVCAPALRTAVHRLVSSQTDGLPVLSYTEASAAGVNIETVGVVRDKPMLGADTGSSTSH